MAHPNSPMRKSGRRSDIADQQAALNEQQFQAQQEQYRQQQAQADEQAAAAVRSTTPGAPPCSRRAHARSLTLFPGSRRIIYQKYAKDYMAKAQDQIDYQKNQATKDLGFALARQGISSSQAGVNQTGLIGETAGRATAEQTTNAQNAAAQLQANTAAARQNLLQQVTASESIGSPIAGHTIEDVNNALQTQRSAISGITSNAGDTVASLCCGADAQHAGHAVLGDPRRRREPLRRR